MEICRLLRTSSRELAALAWEDVDLEKGIVNVRRNLTILDMFGPQKQMPDPNSNTTAACS